MTPHEMALAFAAAGFLLSLCWYWVAMRTRHWGQMCTAMLCLFVFGCLVRYL